MKTNVTLLVLACLVGLNTNQTATAQSTAFTYQGRLIGAGAPANGLYEMQFTLYDAHTNGNVVGTPQALAPVAVSNGLFTVRLDFSASVFMGADRWLEITVNLFGSDLVPTTLVPRQPLTPTPYALHAANAASLMSFANAPLDIKVNGARALRLEPNSALAPNVIGGAHVNKASPGVVGATIAGGGGANLSGVAYINEVAANFGTIGGGLQNTIQPDALSSTISGGERNTIQSNADLSTVGGGFDNTVRSYAARSTISGGVHNTIDSNATYSTIAGGQQNTVHAGANYSTIGGGHRNSADDEFATVGGGGLNHAAGFGAVVAGGGGTRFNDGDPDYGNTASGSWSAVLGGANNRAAGQFSTVGGGQQNTIPSDASHASIGGGMNNTNLGWESVIAGGGWNEVTEYRATIGGGAFNQATGGAATVGGGFQNRANGHVSAVTGGYGNIATGDYGTVGGGQANTSENTASTVAGGENNHAQAGYAAVGGGHGNAASGYASVIAGGGGRSENGEDSIGNRAAGDWTSIGGGAGNTAGSKGATVAGGLQNSSSGTGAMVGGGDGNTSTDLFATVGGGGLNHATGFGSVVAGGGGVHFEDGFEDRGNTASGRWSGVVGGADNVADGVFSVIAGGEANRANGNYGTIPGGLGCEAAGQLSFAAGSGAKALHDGSFVWADNSPTFGGLPPFASTTNNQFNARAAGGVRFFTDFAATTGAELAPGSGAWSSLSDRNAKENFAVANGREILDKVAALPVATWNYKSQDKAVRHLGPMAQDFHAAFGLGESDRTITTVDADGVALAAIQGLNQKVEEANRILRAELTAKAAEIEEVKKSLAELRGLLRATKPQR